MKTDSYRGIMLTSMVVKVLGFLLLERLVAGVGLSINNFYARGFLYADDIRTLATSEASLRHQIELVRAFTDQNLLQQM